MKKITTLFLALMAVSTFSQVTVKEEKVNIGGNKDGFTVDIPYGDVKQIEKALKDELKDWKGKYSDKDYIFADDCKLKEMGKNTFDVFAKVVEKPEGGAIVSVAVDLGGAFLNSKDHNDKSKVMQTKLKKFGVSTAKNVVDEEVKEQEKVLKEREKELADLEDEQKKMEKEIEDYKKKIEESEKSIEESKKAQGDKKAEIKAQEAVVKKTVEKKEAVK